jgi:N-acetylglutamate synthase-like GNAT family acetyltransferase
MYKIIEAKREHRNVIRALIAEANLGEDVVISDKDLENSWVACDGDKIIGCSVLEFINSRAAVLAYNVVKKEYRKQGIGSILIEKRVERCCQNNIQILSLATMFYLFNFYKRRGFATMKRALLPSDIRGFHQFTDPRYMKCAVMVNDAFNGGPYLKKIRTLL